MELHEILDIHRLRQAADEHGVRLVVLFGSYAGGALPPRAHSDVDIAVLPPPTYDRRDYWEIVRALQPAVTRGTPDLLILDGSDPLLQHEVMSRGRLIHGDPDLFAEQKLIAYRRFIDAADLRRLEDRLFQKRMHYLNEVLYGAS